MGGVQVQSTSASGSVIRFGVYEVDLQRCELRKQGLKLRLQGQPFQVLSILLKHPGELVTREDLRVAVWPLDTFVDFDHALNTAVKKVRAALGDDADNPRFVETVPRRGYRFIAPIERAVVAVAPAAPVRAVPYRTLAIIGVVAIVLAVLGLAWRVGPWHRSDQGSSPEFQRLTFDRPDLEDARFMPDGASVVFSTGYSSHNAEIFTQRLGAPVAQSLGVHDALLLAVSREGELAVLRMPSGALITATRAKLGGVLARMSPGGAPRELLPNVEAADWSPDGQLAVVRRINGRSRLEFPIGNVLYENGGWIASPRFSASGDQIAFLDHPSFPDDRGYVAVVDLKGHKKTLSGLWESERGLAWSPNDSEVWFAAAHSGVEWALYAVNLYGQERRLLSVAGGLILRDVARDGRVLLNRVNEQLGIMFLRLGEKEPRDLSWLDWSLAVDISPDGKQILFDEEGGNSGPFYQVGLRPTDGSPPVMLGPGNAQALSPDGKWALSILPSPRDQMLLLPTGPGTAKELERGPIEHYSFAGARFFPDGKQILFAASEPGHGFRCYAQSVEGGKPRPISVDNSVLCKVSPQGSILAMTDDFKLLFYAAGAAERANPKAEKVLQLDPGDAPITWSADGRYLYLAQRSVFGQNPHQPLKITRLEVDTGHRQPWKQFSLPESQTAMKTEGIVMTPDTNSLAYTYSRNYSDLYLVRGLK
jgi:DNA-binding winged helix-turn-helix (wHTH) protein/Tol biopolymer transport system component